MKLKQILDHMMRNGNQYICVKFLFHVSFYNLQSLDFKSFRRTFVDLWWQCLMLIFQGNFVLNNLRLCCLISLSGRFVLNILLAILMPQNKNDFQQAVFKLYDRESTNTLNSCELRDALASAGYHLNNHVLNSLAHRYGTSENTILFDDFISCAIKLKTMIERFKEKDFNNNNEATFTIDEWIIKALYS